MYDKFDLLDPILSNESQLTLLELQGYAGVPEKLGDAPLRLIIVGHNPSEHAWKSGHYYSNPSNRYLFATFQL